MSKRGHGSGPGDVPVAIIGMGCMFPKASDLRAYWRLLRNGTDAITDTPATHWNLADYLDPDPKAPDKTYCGRGGFLEPYPFDPTEFGIPPTLLEATDTSQLLSLVVAKHALEDAGYGEARDFNRDRTGVILGVTGLQELAIPLSARLGHPLWRRALTESGVAPAVAEEVMQRISDGYVAWQESSFPGLLGNVVAGRIANRLNLRGTNCVVDAACASSLSAVHLAMMELATGRCDMALAGGVDTLNDIFMYMCFSKTPALSPTGDARPFSDDADGTVLGEGIGMLVLKRLSEARRDGDRIYAVIRAVGTSSDGRSQSIYAPHAGGQARALRNAYVRAGVEPESIGLIEAHGTGTKVGDAVEFEALQTVFRESSSDGTWCALGSVKSQIGHTKAAAGAAGLIKAALALHYRAIPPSIKIQSPNPKMNIEDSPFYLCTELRPWIAPIDRPRRAGVSSFGFGGSNFHVVLEEHAAAKPEPAWDGSVQIISLCGNTPAVLHEALEHWQRGVHQERWTEAEIAYHAHQSRKTFDSSRTHRLVLVYMLGDDLGALLERAVAVLRRASDDARVREPDIHYGFGPAVGRLAYLYPGQGSQYVHMGRDLTTRFPEMLDALIAADACHGHGEMTLSSVIHPLPARDEAMQKQQSVELTRTEFAQPALAAVEVGMTRVLARFGVRPEMTAGHSFGELCALWAGGAMEEESLHELAGLRGRLMGDGAEDRGTMVAVSAPLAEIERMIDEERLDVVLANRNTPKQGVLSGPREAVNLAVQACARRGLACTPLKVSAAFHSEAMQPAVGPWRNALEATAFVEPSVAVYSNVTAQPYLPEAQHIREHLAEQIVRPVDFVGMVRRMVDDGVQTFVEVGPRAVLAGLAESIVEGRGVRVLAIDASSGRRDSLADLARLLARLAADGRSVDLEKWERPAPEPRKPRMVVPLVGANYRAPRGELSRLNESRSIAVTPPARLESIRSTQVAEPIVPTPSTVRAMAATMSEASMNREFTIHPVPPVPAVPTTPPTKETDRLREAARVAQEGIAAMQALAAQTAAAHQRFLEGQEQAHRALQQLLENQQRLLTGQPALPTTPMVPVTPVTATPSLVEQSAPRVEAVDQAHDRGALATPVLGIKVTAGQTIGKAEPAVAKAASVSMPLSSVERVPSPDKGFETVVLDVVCEKTGYPREMIDLGMDIEADLGIDSIKRVEIVAAIEERVPGFGGIKPEYMGSIRTLGDILSFLDGERQAGARESVGVVDSAGGSVAPRPADVVSVEEFATTLLDVVSQLTGYPREMLDLSMDLEADLGIDSIKRVEILAGVESRVPKMPPVQPEYMGSLRTLQQIVDYCAGHAVAQSATPVVAPVGTIVEPPKRETPTMESATVERRVLVPVELTPIELQSPRLAPGGEIWITDDDADLADALRERWRRAGHAVRIVGLKNAPDSTAAVSGLILTSSRAEGDPAEWLPAASQESLRDALLLSARLAKSLTAAAANGGALFAGIVRMDGRFGLSGDDFDAVRAGLTALVKTARHEWPGVRCKTIDVSNSWNDLDAVADAVLRELSADGPVEIGLDGDRRIGLELREASIQPGRDESTLAGVFLVTGGARGVTAECLAALARRGRPTLVLLGRSPAPAKEPEWLAGHSDEAEIKRAIVANEFAGELPKAADVQQVYERRIANREIARNLSRLRALGARVEYRSLDVRDAEAVRAVVEEVVSSIGPVCGLIHAAGVLEDRRIADKTARQFDKVFETKVAGLRNLLNAVPPDELKSIVLFSSVSARFGNRGQCDYAMANEVLNKVARQIAARRPGVRVRSINWGPWDGGMVTPALKREFERRGVRVIPPAAGAERFVDELLDGSDAVEVVIGSGFDSRLPTRDVNDVGAGAPPLVDSTWSVSFERVVDAASHGFLESHVLAGRPVLPLAMAMEWLGHAALHALPGLKWLGFEDVRVLRGVTLENGPVTLTFVTGAPSQRDGQTFVEVELRSESGGRSQVHVAGTAVLNDRPPTAPSIAYSDATAQTAYPRGVNEIYRDVLFHGPHLQSIRKIDGISSRGIIVQAARGAPPSAWMDEPVRSEWLAEPAVIDAAFQAAILWCQEEMGLRSLPARVGRYRQYRDAFPRDGVSIVLEVREHTSRRMVCDVTFFDLDAAVVARIEGYECTADASLAAAFGASAGVRF